MAPTLRLIPACLLLAFLALACGSGPPDGVVVVAIPGPMPVLGETVVLEARLDLPGAPADPTATRYQWRFNGRDIPGAWNDTLELAAVSRAQAGSYQVQVQTDDLGGTVVSAPLALEPVDHAWVVTRAADEGPGSLREAMARAAVFPGLNGIRFALEAGEGSVIRLASGLPPVGSGQLEILGPEDPLVTVDGGGACRPFFVTGGATLVLDHLVVANGLAQGGDAPGGGGAAAGMGGGLFINKGQVTLRRMLFLDCQALGGGSSPGGDGGNGGGGGCGGGPAGTGGDGGGGGPLGGRGGTGHLDGTASTDAGGGPAVGDGAGGGAARGGLLADPVSGWADNLPGGEGTFGGGGGFSVGPLGGGGDSTTFGGGGGGSGGSAGGGLFLPGAGSGAGATFGGDGGKGDGVTGGTGGGGAGCGGAVFFRAGALALDACRFYHNAARGGAGAQRGLGKGGAIFIYAFDESQPAVSLAVLQAQNYRDNSATDLVEDPSFDNDNYYVAQALLDYRPGSPLDLLYRRYRLDLKMGLPWRR